MRNEINPTPEFIAKQHTGKLIELLPDTFMIKGAKNERGFDQGYALKRNKNEFLLIDTVELAHKDAIAELLSNGNSIVGILITGPGALQDAYADLETISKDTGGAAIYLHSELSSETNFETKNPTSSDPLLSSFDITLHELPRPTLSHLVFSRKNGGMLFPGDSAKGAPYDSNSSMVTREKLETTSQEFALVDYWREFDPEFRYFFPRQGKPITEIEAGSRRDILNRLSRAEA